MRPGNCESGLSRGFYMGWKIDGTLYPDCQPPARLSSLPERVDFLARLCAAWDFGLLPDVATVAEVRHRRWQAAVDACLLLTSPKYHLLRHWHRLPRLPFLGGIPAYIRNDPNLDCV
jgi:hypothetical protein